MQSEVAFGTCSAPLPDGGAHSFVDLRLSAMDMVVHWRRCSLTADFLAGFVAQGFEGREEEARLELSMVIDELIENAVKFCADVREPVSVMVHNYGDVIVLEASNLCDLESAQALEAAIRRVLESDLESLFIQQIEESASSDRLSSRLGFITLCVNHGARLGARISKLPQKDLYTVTVQVLLDRPEVVR